MATDFKQCQSPPFTVRKLITVNPVRYYYDI